LGANGTSKGPVSRGGIAKRSRSDPRAASAVEVEVAVEVGVAVEVAAAVEVEVEVGAEVGVHATRKRRAVSSAFMHYPSKATPKV